MLLKAQLRWVGDVIRMEVFRMPRRLMYGEFQLGKRNQGRPKLRYKDSVKANLQWCHIKPRELKERAMDRPVWRASIQKALSNFKEARSQKFTAARERRHKAASAVITTTDSQCPHCSVTSVCIDEQQSAKVIIGSNGQPPCCNSNQPRKKYTVRSLNSTDDLSHHL